GPWDLLLRPEAAGLLGDWGGCGPDCHRDSVCAAACGHPAGLAAERVMAVGRRTTRSSGGGLVWVCEEVGAAAGGKPLSSGIRNDRGSLVRRPSTASPPPAPREWHHLPRTPLHLPDSGLSSFHVVAECG